MSSIKELKVMNQKELCIWSSNVNIKELKAILKENGFKGYSRLKKTELLNAVLDMIVSDEEIEKVMEDTKKLNEEINARQSFEEEFESTLYARWAAKEITWEEFKQTIINYNISIPINVTDEEDTKDILNRKYDMDSMYEHYVFESNTCYYSVLNKDFEWDNVFRNNGKYRWQDWEEQQMYERNTIDKDGLQLAFDFDENSDYTLLVYKNYKLLGSYTNGQIDDINRLIEYDDRLSYDDLDAYTELLELLDKQYEEYDKIINEHWEKERKARQEREAREKKYKEAYDRWSRFYQPYVYGKYKFEGIWNNAGEIKNYNLWSEMEKLARQERDKREQEYKQQYSNLFGNSAEMVVKEEDKDVYKRIYRIASLKLHPDVAKDNGRAMTILNKLKEQWGI